MTTAASKASRFELAPPRRFILPAILLLLSEAPGYGYALVPLLQELRFGRIDRPAVYRALALLEHDGLVEASSQSPRGGQARRVYRVTPLGERVLREWMGVIKEEHDHLEHVLRRYRATGTTDAMLAEVGGAWASTLGSGWSAVSSTSASWRHLISLIDEDSLDTVGGAAPDSVAQYAAPASQLDPPRTHAHSPQFEEVDNDPGAHDQTTRHRRSAEPHPIVGINGDGATADGTNGQAGADIRPDPTERQVHVHGRPIGGIEGPEPRRFGLLPHRSVVLIEVRSTVGPLSFGAIGVTGWVQAAIADGALREQPPPSAHLEIDVTGLSAGNSIYDAELLRRIDAHRYPKASVELLDCMEVGPGARYSLKGELTFHGVSRPAQGTVGLVASDRGLVITGAQVFDIRDFAIPSPTVLMLRIYPDVRVRLHAEAELREEP